MDLIFRSTLVYFIILLILRAAGKRTMSEITTFDFILLLIIGEATQQALLGFDHSVTGAILVIATLVTIDFLVSVFSYKYKLFDMVANGVPILLLENGHPIKRHMDKARISKEDILVAARKSQGIESIDQIKYAILEKDGSVSIVPK